jgi:hypothetical protein
VMRTHPDSMILGDHWSEHPVPSSNTSSKTSGSKKKPRATDQEMLDIVLPELNMPREYKIHDITSQIADRDAEEVHSIEEVPSLIPVVVSSGKDSASMPSTVSVDDQDLVIAQISGQVPGICASEDDPVLVDKPSGQVNPLGPIASPISRGRSRLRRHASNPGPPEEVQESFT